MKRIWAKKYNDVYLLENKENYDYLKLEGKDSLFLHSTFYFNKKNKFSKYNILLLVTAKYLNPSFVIKILST